MLAIAQNLSDIRGMLLKHSAIYSASILLNGLISFAAVAVNTRLLGVEEYGHYALAFSAATCASTFFFEWLRLSIMRFSETENGQRLLSASLSLYLVGAIIILTLATLFFAVNFDAHFPALGWIAVGLFAVCIGCVDLLLSLARTSLRPSLFSSMQIMRGVLALALGGLAAWMKFGFAGVMTGMALANILTLVFGLLRQPEWRRLRPTLPDKDSVLTLMQFGSPIVLTVMAMQVLLILDRYMISHFHGAKEVGAYAAAGDITQKLIVMIATGVSLASYNLVLRVFEEGGVAEAEKKMVTTLTVLLSVVLPVSVGIALVAAPMGHLLLGAKVAEEAVPLMPLLSIIAVLQVLRSYYFDQPYHILKITKQIFLPYLAASVVAMTSWFLLIPSEGARGAAYGLIFAHLVGGVVSFLSIRGKFKLDISWKDVSIVIVAVTAMAIIVGLLPWPDGNIWLFVRVAAGGAAYAVSLLAANFLDVRSIVLKKLKLFGRFQS